MYLKKLKLSGFKSFAEKTYFDFGQGMTAIVGPNGSGKSNIADAMRWVLGEQSLKSLRGKKGEDVIFTGSDKKTRSSMASVSLYFDNQDGRMPVDYQEVIVSRKLFRGGESEYLINNNKVRLLDIVELLSKSGVGQKGYCVINQGMADAILQSSPSERMAIFEEATGVRQYQIKKEQSLNKLESTRQNLVRVTDLLGEIEPRLNSLKRQANKAQKREGAEKELKTLRENLYSHLWRKLETDEAGSKAVQEKMEEKISRAEKETNEVKNKLAENEKNNKTDQGDYENLQKKSEAAQEKINILQRDLSIAEGRIEVEKEKMEKLKNPEEAPVNLAYVKEKISSFYSAFENLFNLILKSEKGDNVNNLKKEAEETRALLKNILGEIKSGKIKIKESRITNQESRVELDKLVLEKDILEDKLNRAKEEYLKIKNKIAELNQADRERRKSFFEMEKELRERQDELNRFKNKYNSARIDLAKFEVRREDLKAEIIEELQSDEICEDAKNKNAINRVFADMKNKINNANTEETKFKIRKLKYQLEQIGGIDPLVMEEYRETKERFEFLSGQSRDLTEASESLKKVIKELDKKIEKIFSESFKNINREFGKYFKIVFGGGKASLKIKYARDKKIESGDEELSNSGSADTNDLTRSPKIPPTPFYKGGNSERGVKIGGIEISAVPPGKKITDLSMLSGGERALTSVAILFAIVSNNPPPFSILDEIDAALDEANSARLGKIIKELSDKTQFIMITHNRAIMENAEILYGITMQDDGVSKILSLKMEGGIK